MKEIHKKTIDWVLYVLIIAMLSVAVVNNSKEEEGTTYCLEWGGFITRDLLVFQCYNFADQEILCDYNIDYDTNELIISSYPDKDNILSKHKCTLTTNVKYIMHTDPSEYYGDPSVPIVELQDGSEE